MARRPRRTQIGEQFMARVVGMLESPAYRALSLSGHRVISRLEVELAHHGGTDIGRLPCTYDDFESYGIHRHSISSAIRECVALGFVEVTEAGQAGNAEFRKPTRFRLTYAYTDKSCPPTHEWRKLETEQQASDLARMARGKSRIPVAENGNSQCGNHHRKPEFHSAETTTTSISRGSPEHQSRSGNNAATLPSPHPASLRRRSRAQ